MTEHPKPYVREELDARSMHFGATEIQSRMRIREPSELQLEYTRLMMGFLRWEAQPANLLLLGLGGGSIAKFCHRHLLSSRILAVEINPHVIALRDAFDVPTDDARFEIVEADAARYVAETALRFDVVLVDCFNADGMPEALGSQRFYDDCCDILVSGGIFVANLHTAHPHSPVHVGRIQHTFEGRFLKIHDSDGGNSVVFARKGVELSAEATKPVRRPASLDLAAWNQVQRAFSRIAHGVREELP